MLCLSYYFAIILWVLVYRGDFLELLNKIVINIQCSSYLIFKGLDIFNPYFEEKKSQIMIQLIIVGITILSKQWTRAFFAGNLMNFIEEAVCQKWEKLFSIYCRTNFQVFAETYTFWDFLRCWETENYIIIIYVISIDKNGKFFLAVFCSSFIFHQVWELSTNDTSKWTY